MFARVIVDISNANVNRLFTYAVPEEISLCEGQRVIVPFGRGNRPIEGFVLELVDEPGTEREVSRVRISASPPKHLIFIGCFFLSPGVRKRHIIEFDSLIVFADAFVFNIPERHRRDARAFFDLLCHDAGARFQKCNKLNPYGD